MSEPAVRVADVADSIVATYLYALVTRLAPDRYPSEAWFRVTTGSSRIPVEIGEINEIVEPTFEVVLVVDRTMPGLLEKLTDAAASMPGRVRVLPEAVMDDSFARESFHAKGWKQVPVPRLTEPELVGV